MAFPSTSDHVPYRNSKLTRMLQPSLSGDARISVICTLNPEPGAAGESTSTLLFAQRVKKVHVSTDVLFSLFCSNHVSFVLSTPALRIGKMLIYAGLA